MIGAARTSGEAVVEIIAPGLLATLQDGGRPGWRRFGVPASGVMDEHAAAAANLAVGNETQAPVLELLLQGARLRTLTRVRLAVTGAVAGVDLPMWQGLDLEAGRRIDFPQNRSGVWMYVAVAGGFVGDLLLGSRSAYPRGGIGRALSAGDQLRRNGANDRRSGITPLEPRRYEAIPSLRVWPGPQWHRFSAEARAAFFATPWTVSSQSDRVGYRLAGPPLPGAPAPRLSEPVLPGTIQVPENGLPIVTMRDGPTVGGYAKLGLVEPADLSWLSQARPGVPVRFQPFQAG